MERDAERKEQGKDSWVFSHREELSPPKDSRGAKQQRTAVLLSPGVRAHALQSGSRRNLGQLPFKYKGVEGQGGARSWFNIFCLVIFPLSAWLDSSRPRVVSYLYSLYD